MKLRMAEKTSRWKGGKPFVRKDGYVFVYSPEHLKSHRGRIYEHILIAEKALGRPLPKGVEVHHLLPDRANNQNNNLVICENASYHALLHIRQRIVDAGGNPNTEKLCCTCKTILPRSSFYIDVKRGDGYKPACKACHNAATIRSYHKRRKGAGLC